VAAIGRSSAPRRTAQGVPLIGYALDPSGPPVTVLRRGPGGSEQRGGVGDTHAHDFLVIASVEAGESVLRVDGSDEVLRAGDVFVVPPGAVVAGEGPRGSHDAQTWLVFFPAEAVRGGAALVSWRHHPLLASLAGPAGSGRRLRLPPEDRETWFGRLATMRDELHARREGHAEAVRAHLTLLLVHLGRLDVDVPFAPSAEPLLAAVFDVIEARYHEPISLADVAGAVAESGGHLTTVVRRRTGRTVGQWITERRLREARRLLADTDLTVAEVARRVGYADAGYFIRRFRTEHGVAPGEWRRAGTPAR
jgi:AraC family transcriptional regulator, transcriptional activator of pobA